MGSYATKQSHGKAAGYIVYATLGPGTLCHGNDGRDLILFGSPATLFPTLARARRAIADSVACGRFGERELSISRVAPPAKAPAAPATRGKGKVKR